MLRHYLVLSVKVLLRRKFFTAISLFGITFTLVVMVVVSALFDHVLAPGLPEVNQERALGAHRAVMYQADAGAQSSSPGFKLFDRYARDLPGVERLSIFSTANSVQSFVQGHKVTSYLKRTDGEFWRVFQFAFIEGNAFSTADVDDARFVAVISRNTRERLLAGQPAVGASIEADGQRFRVVGVVENVSEMRFAPSADIWVPLTTAKSPAYRDQLMGGFQAIVLAESPAALQGIRDEFNSRLSRVELPEGYDGLVAPFESKFETLARWGPTADRNDPESQAPGLIALLAVLGLLFALLPAVNLVNINVSRILERSSEIGVRKAFGASSRTLVGQFVVENVLLTLVGASIAFVLSYFILDAINRSGAVGYVALELNLRVFAIGIALALAFGILSGVYPAWRMSRLHPVSALKGAVR